MTRKALRKARQARPSTAGAANRSSASPFLTFSAVVTTAALTGLAANVSAADRADPRLAVITPRAPAPRRRAQFARHRRGRAAGRQTLLQFDIPAGPIRDVVAAFERVTGATVTISLDSIGPISSPGLTGTFTFEQALRMLLEGTNVAFRLTSARTAVLTLPVAQRVGQRHRRRRRHAVASPKYTVPLRDIPQTIEVIPRAAMEAQGVTTLSEALRNVPGITLQAGEGGGASSTAGDMFNMRGFNASNSLFVDNVRDDGLVSRDVFNLEQVEVFMGPTGSDVGRGTAAGYVNMQTKTPHLPRAGSATLTFGTADQRRGDARPQPAARRSATRDSWIGKSAVRLNALWQDSGVAGTRRGRERDARRSRRRSASASARRRASSRRRRCCARTTCPTTAFPAPPGTDSLLAPTTVHADTAGRSEQLLRQPGLRLRPRRPEHGHWRASSTTSTPRWTVSNQTRYNRTEREAVISTVQNGRVVRAGDRAVTLARQGNVRENQITSNQTDARRDAS